MKLLANRIARRALSLVAAHLLLSAAAGALATGIGDQAVPIGLAVCYGGAAAVFVLMMLGVNRQAKGSRLRLLAGLVVSAGVAAIAAFASIIILVNVWEGAGLSH